MDTTNIAEKAQSWGETAEEMHGEAQKWKRALTDKAQNTGRVIQDYVHENTWMSVAIAAAVGCVVGLLVSRSRD